MEVWYFRHGERCDEVSREHDMEGKSWRRSALYREGRSYDPPLTQLGHTQAGRVGTYLKNLLLNQDPEKGQSGFDCVYTSPLLRDVQTAVCLSLKLGDLPLQVVPGLCSCTVALRRIGVANATLMSDAAIVDRFPGINVLPRDSLAPNSFRGATDWLADRPSRRVLCIEHREGMRKIVVRSVSPPSWRIGIFQVDRERRRYELLDLLCNDGTKAGLRWCSPSSQPLSTETKTARSNSGIVRHRLHKATDRVATLTIAGDDKLGLAPIRRSTSEATTIAKKPPLDSTKKCILRRGSTELGMLTGRHQHPHTLSFKETPGLGLHDTISKRANRSSVSEEDAKGSNSDGRDLPNTDRADTSTRLDSLATRAVERVRLAGSTVLSSPVVMKPSQESSNIDIAVKCRDLSARRAGARSKPARLNPCAGRGCRIDFLSRSTSRGVVSPTLPGIPQDALCGSLGVLSFLRPVELCMAQVTCKAMATAASSDNIWSTIIDRLPRYIRDEYTPSSAQDTKQPTKKKGNFKTIFTHIIHVALCARAVRNAKKVRALRSRLGTIHSQRAFVGALRATLVVSLAGSQVAIVDSRGPRPEAWASRSNVLSEPSVRNGLRTFTLSSSIKVDLPGSPIAVSQLRSMHVTYSVPDHWLSRATVFRKNGLLLSRARLLGTSADNAVALYDVVQDSSDHGNRDSGTVTLPEPRACVLLGVLQSNHQGGSDDDDVGFLTVHCPHEMLLHAATRRRQGRDQFEHVRRQSYMDNSAGSKHGLENFTFALCLRTLGVPVWEAARMGVDGYMCGCSAASQFERAKATQREPLVLVDIMCPSENLRSQVSAVPDTERTLHGGPGLPFCTSSRLSGIIENVLIADFIAIDTNGNTMWAFASPMVFAISPMSESGGVGADSDFNGLVDMRLREVRKERRRGVVHEPGVGRVVVELALVESDETVEKGSASRQRCPAGHTWIVRAARVELELGFVNTWFGTKHGHPSG